jgi:hypothetical protein
LALLDGQYSDIGNGVAQGSYAFWLGSGISRGRVIGLNGVLEKLLEFIRGKITTDPACKYRTALNEIIDKASPSDAERAEIDFAIPVSNWACTRILLERLWKQYSSVLSVDVGEPLDYLLWVGLDFAHTFSVLSADAEHLVIGMLALEGVVTQFASANWDGLIEAAMTELGHDASFFCITVTGNDLRNTAAAARLYKFHGCALRAIDKESEYRPLLIARSAQILSWSGNAKFKIVRDQLTALVQANRTLMIGMSAQDVNIKQLFVAVNQQQGWKWSDRPTPIVFSAQELEPDQKDLLNAFYGDRDYEDHGNEIREAARLQAYAKPLLLALLLQVLVIKLEVLASDAHAPNLDVAARAQIVAGIKALRDHVADAGDSDRLKLARAIAACLARARHQLQNGTSAPGIQPYFPLAEQPAPRMKNNAALKSTGQREAAVALGLIGLDEQASVWTTSVDDPSDARTGALRLSSFNATARIFLAANDDTITSLLECGAFAETDDDVVVICSGRVTSRQQRSPGGDLRSGAIGPRYLALGSMLSDVANLIDLRDRFREEIGL